MTSSASVTPLDSVSGALAFDQAGAVKVVLATPETYANGLGFYANAVCTGSGPVATYSHRLAFNALRQLIVDAVGAITAYSSGLPFTALGLAVTTVGTVPVISYELREDNSKELREGSGFELRER